MNTVNKRDNEFEITVNAMGSMFAGIFNVNDSEIGLYRSTARLAYMLAPDTFFINGHFKVRTYSGTLPSSTSFNDNYVVVYFNRLRLYVVFIKDASKESVTVPITPVLDYDDCGRRTLTLTNIKRLLSPLLSRFKS